MELLNGKSGLNHLSPAKIDISVLKLLGFESFANFLRVSVSENLVSEKKVLVSVPENLVLKKSK